MIIFNSGGEDAQSNNLEEQKLERLISNSDYTMTLEAESLAEEMDEDTLSLVEDIMAQPFQLLTERHAG